MWRRPSRSSARHRNRLRFPDGGAAEGEGGHRWGHRPLPFVMAVLPGRTLFLVNPPDNSLPMRSSADRLVGRKNTCEHQFPVRRFLLELADASAIAALLSNEQLTERPCVRRADLHREPARAVKGRRPCHCGSCAPCLENAKWERIFSEKFADADYYKPRSVWGGSSLGWLRSL